MRFTILPATLLFTTTTLLLPTALLVSAAGAPGDRSIKLLSNGNPKICLNLRGGAVKEGAQVEIQPCDSETNPSNPTPQRWNLFQGQTEVRVWGISLCLDAGSDRKPGTQLTVQNCNENSPSQKWFYDEGVSNQIRLTDTDLCADLVNGVETNGNSVQTWQCSDTSKSAPGQVWVIGTSLNEDQEGSSTGTQ